MADAVQNAESATADLTFSDFVAEKNTATTSETPVETQPSLEDKAAPASEPETTTQETKGLTDDEKADRKRRNDERRERRWYEERGEMRAQMKALESKLAELQANRGNAAAPQADDDEPVLQAYIDSGKYKTYEEAQQQWMRDSRKYVRDQIRAEESVREVHQTRETIKESFERNIREYKKTHPDFEDSFDAVRDALEGTHKTATPLTAYLVRAKDGVALIDHIGQRPALLESLASMPHDDAIAEIGAIRRELKADKSPETTEVPETSARVPKTVRARGDVPNHLQAMNKADDFRKFRDAKNTARKSGARF
jgi:hypothetical protein